MRCIFCGQHISSIIEHQYIRARSEHMRAMALLPRKSLRGTTIARERASKAGLASAAKKRAQKAALPAG